MNKIGKMLVVMISLVMVATVLAAAEEAKAAAPHVSGAIFTTLEYGQRVNANIYQDKRDVYLDGGPGPNAPQGAAGLPDGNYYFQVTDPSGKKLLSEDPAYCREFKVIDGIIAEFVSIGRTYTVGNGKNGKVVPCHIDGWQYGQHDLGWDMDHGALTIQLMPYKDTPNKGGVYKAWATPTDHFEGDPNLVDPGYSPGFFHGFIPSFSKTDNFKVKKGQPPVTPEIEICKFEDLNGNGVLDTGELYLQSWKMMVTDPLGVTNNYYTGQNGCVVIDATQTGTYIIEEEIPDGWGVTTTIVDGTPIAPTNIVELQVNGKQTVYTVTFGNFECFDVDGYKYEDLDGDGILDGGEPGIEGWHITLYRWADGGWEPYDDTYTDENGYYKFTVCEGGDFKVQEEDVGGWVHTSASFYTFTGLSGVDQGPFNFLNFECFYVSGYKYEDMNGDGNWDVGDTGIPGWHIILWKKDASGVWKVFDEMGTDGSGHYSFYVCQSGEFKVEEEVQDGWIATAPTEYTFTGVSGQSQTFDFFNFQLGQICGIKWYDVDRDGVMDGSEEVIEGFKFELWKNGALYATAFSDEFGEYCFYDLGPGSYEVIEIMPNDPGEYLQWAQTYPESGTWTFEVLLSGTIETDADFGNVVYFTGGLTWGYWKTHTGYDAPPRDPAYDLLPYNPMQVDILTPDGNHFINNDYEAKWMFDSTDPNCSGEPGGEKCRSLFRAQLLALHMNLLKFPGMGDALYIYGGDPHSGDTVQEIYDDALTLLNDGLVHDFTDFQNTLDRINNNGNTHILVIATPPVPEY